MPLQMQKKAEKTSPYKSGAYADFVRWMASPFIEKVNWGIKNQGQFAEIYGVNKDTLTRWKERPEFEAEVKALMHKWGFERTPAVIDAIAIAAIKGNAKSQKIWMEYFTNFKKGGNDQLPLVQPDDIRFHIGVLPPDLQLKYNTFLIDLKNDYEAFEEGRFDDMTNSPNHDGL